MPIVAAFPNAVAAFTDKFDFTDIVFAAHINALQAEVVALETILGTLPQGTSATVKARINTLEASIATLSGRFDSSGLIPQSGVTGLVAALAGKAASGHTHVDADITDLSGAYVYHASIADSATNAGHATSADSATNAGHATSADSATSASSAGHASSADSVPWGGVSGVPSLVNAVNGLSGSPVLFTHGLATVTFSGGLSTTRTTHGLGTTPSTILCTPYTGGTTYPVGVENSVDSSTFRARSSVAGAYSFYWVAFL